VVKCTKAIKQLLNDLPAERVARVSRCPAADENRSSVLSLAGCLTDVNTGASAGATFLSDVNGELLDENEIVTGYRKSSARFSIQGNNPQKESIHSGRVATEAITTGGPSLIGSAVQRFQYLRENQN
jgi:hypothetical protein